MPKSQAAKELAAKQKAQAKAEKERRKHSDNPKDWGTGKQLVETFKLTRQVDPQLLWWVIGSFVAGVVVFTVLGLILTDLWWAWLIVGIFAGAAAAMWVFQWRAKRSMYARFKGQTGSAEVALSLLDKKKWTSTPAIAFTRQQDGCVLIEEPLEEGKNVLPRGGDVRSGKRILTSGQTISPAMAGLLAAAGHSVVAVFGSPVVGIVGTGDEIVEPGRPLSEGKLYASNIVTLAGWCNKYNMESRTAIVGDDYDAIFATFRQMSAETDVMITSGGAWTGDRDLVTGVLEGLGWKEVFHRIRMGPGKAVGFGTLGQKPVFILPGGPPSNLMGFLQIALPGLMSLCGHANPGLPRIAARLASDLGEGEADWTDFFYGTLEANDGLPLFHPMKKRSRLTSMAEAGAVTSIPEGQDHLPEGSLISVQLLT